MAMSLRSLQGFNHFRVVRRCTRYDVIAESSGEKIEYRLVVADSAHQVVCGIDVTSQVVVPSKDLRWRLDEISTLHDSSGCWIKSTIALGAVVISNQPPFNCLRFDVHKSPGADNLK